MALIQTTADLLSSSPAMTGYVCDLDTPLLMFNEMDVFDLRSAASGILCMGGTGSGKSSSSGALIARSYLKAGFGGLVLCVNTDEAERWRGYAAETNRTQSLVIIDGSLAHRFNFLEYQMAVGRGSVGEAVNVLVEILDAAEGKVADKADGNAFWDTAMRQLPSNAIGPLWAAYGRLTWRRNAGENENSSTGTSTNTNSSSAGGKTSHSSGGGTTRGEGRGSSWGASEMIDYRLQPSHFTTLKKGGGADRMSEAVIFEAGRVFAYTRSTWTPVLFRQE